MRSSFAFAAVAGVLPTAFAAAACPPLELIYGKSPLTFSSILHD